MYYKNNINNFIYDIYNAMETLIGEITFDRSLYS